MNRKFNKTKTTVRTIDKKMAFAVIMVLMLTFSSVTMIIPAIFAQKTTIGLSTGFYPIIGINSPTLISWSPTPASVNPIIVSPAYAGSPIWPDATITFTKPDGSTEVINGPFKARHSLVQGRASRVDVVLVYTPDMMGEWTVTFYWPGDDSYNEVTQTDTFTVKEHFEKREVWAFLSLKPYPNIGLEQPVLINAWISMPPISQRDYYENYTFTFSGPSGASFTVGPMDSELPGTVWFDIPLTEIGNWDITFNFPGDDFTSPASITRTITVQEDWVPVGYPDTPLPTEEWTFPINVQNREWRNIAGPWYDDRDYNASKGAWNPYTEAPRTAHLLWKLPSYGQIGGFIGSPHSIETGSGQSDYDPGDAGIFSSSVPSIGTIMAGRGYWTGGGMIHCVDMRTGEELWAVEGSFDVGTRRGRTAALYDFGNRFVAYDAITGVEILDVPGMSMVFFEDPYVYSMTTDYLIKWSTDGTTNNFENRVVWNITNEVMPGPGATVSSTSYHCIQDGVWVIMGHNRGNQASIMPTTLKGIDTQTGETLYIRRPVVDESDYTKWFTTQGPATGSGFGLFYFAAVRHEEKGLTYMAIDAKTGEEAWVSEATNWPWGNFWAYSPQPSAHDMIFGLSYSGVYAFNVTNGEIVWHYSADDLYFEEPYASNIDKETGEIYASYSFGSTGGIVGGDILFAPNTEHSPTFIYRGQQLHAIDVFTGEKVWSIKGVHVPRAVAYGILTTTDSYNGFSYAFGKGSTETTVSASSKVVDWGSSILIEGTVMDQSPAQKGTPAIGDEYMTEWIEYLHMQQPCPSIVEGVEVVLTTHDPNGNNYEIGRTTSDASGLYSIFWEPPVPGKYTIIATFEGSESYYSSYAEMAIGVAEAPAPSGAIEPAQPEPTTTELTQSSLTEPELMPTEPEPTTLEPSESAATEIITESQFIANEITIIAVVVVACIIGIFAFWALRKRK